MYVCAYVCMSVRVYVHAYVCICVRLYVCTYVWMYVCMYVRMYLHEHRPSWPLAANLLNKCTCIYIYIYIYMCTFVCMYVRTCGCMYVYMYVCTHIYASQAVIGTVLGGLGPSWASSRKPLETHRAAVATLRAPAVKMLIFHWFLKQKSETY